MLMTSMAGSFASELEGNQATPPANDPPAVIEPVSEPAPESVQEPPAAEPEASSDGENTPPEEPEVSEGSDESDESVDEGQTGSDEGTPDEPGTEPAGDTEKDPAGESDGKQQDEPVQDDSPKQQDEPAKDQPDGQQDGEAKPADQNQTGEGKPAEQNPDGKDQEKAGQTDQPEEQGSVPTDANGSGNNQESEQGAAPVNQGQAQPEQNQTGAQEAPVPQNQNETQEPETPPTAIQAEQNEDEGLNELTVNGGRKSATADPETPVRMFLKAEETETILLIITLAADDEIDLQINSASQSPEDTALNEEETEKTLTFRKDVETGNAYLLEISAEKQTDFSIEAVSVPEENPDEQKPEEDDEDKEQTEVQKDEEIDENVVKSTDETGTDKKDEESSDDKSDSEEKTSKEGEIVYSEGGTFTSSGADYTVTVTYGADARFPEGTVLDVEEILPSDPRYAEMTGLSADKLIDDDWKEMGDYQRVFDITFQYAGAEIEPEAAIQVDFQFSSAISLEENSSLEVVHVDSEKNAEVVSSETPAASTGENGTTDVDTLSFTSDSFSTYIISQTKEVTEETISDDEQVVSITYGKDSDIPRNAQVSVTKIEEGTEAYEAYRRQLIKQMNIDETRQTVRFSALYDITIQNEQKVDISMNADATVTVTAALPEEAAQQDNLLVVHFDEAKEEAVELNATANNDNTVTFETNGFSVYGFAYTVDYTFENHEYHMQGETSMLLSELFEKLSINADAADAINVTFTNDALLAVEKTENDWTLTSLKPFTSQETLTVTMSDDTVYVIAVTDAQEYSNLSDYITDASLTTGEGTFGKNDIWNVIPDVNYSLKLQFAEKGSRQFPKGGDTMSMVIPSGLNIPDGTTGTFDIPAGLAGTITGNTYRVQNGRIYITFGEDPKDIMTRSSNVHFELSFNASVSSSATEISFSDKIHPQITIDNTTDLIASKTANYNHETGKMDYTVTIKSKGRSKNVSVKDYLTNNSLLVFDKNISISPSDKAYTDYKESDLGFELKIAEMAHDEVVTITYSASVNPSALEHNGTIKQLEDATNTLIAENQDKTVIVPNTYNNTIKYSSTSKTNTGVADDEIDPNKAVLDWKVVLNENFRGSIVGDTIKDTIDWSSKDGMKYASPLKLTINAKNKDGTINHTKEVTVTPTENANGQQSWTYIIEQFDSEEEILSYEINYQTIVDKTSPDIISSSGFVKNNVENEGDGSATGTGIIPGIGGGGESGHDDISGGKKATNVTSEYIDWDIVVVVPAEGFPNDFVVTDEVPHLYGHSDTFDKILSIEGLTDKETYDVSVSKAEGNNWDIATIQFYRDSTKQNKGLESTDSSRTLTIKLRTKNDDQWITEAETRSGGDPLYFHTNTAKVNKTTFTGSAIPLHSKVIKTVAQGLGNNGSGMNSYPNSIVYKIILSHVTEVPVTITDTFDSDILAFVGPGSSYSGWDRIAAASQQNNLNGGVDGFVADYSENNGTLTITANSLPKKEDGSYYEYYAFYYVLQVKDLDEIASRAIANGGIFQIGNTVKWNGSEDHFDYEFEEPVLTKTGAFAAEYDWNTNSYNGNERKYRYSIDINPNAKKLLTDGEATLDLTDTHTSNLSVDYSTVKVYYYANGTKTEDNSIQWNFNGNVGEFYDLLDETHYVIEYECFITGTGEQEFTNEAVLKSFVSTKTDKRTFDHDGQGGADVYQISLIKYKNGMTSERLAGATFQLFQDDGNGNPQKMTYGDTAETRRKGIVGKNITFTTNSNGYVRIALNQTEDGAELEEGVHYYLKEIASPPGYQIDGSVEYWSFTLTSDASKVSYGDRDEDGIRQWIYFSYDDILKINNTPTEEPITVKVDKYWLNADGTPMEESEKENLVARVQLKQKKNNEDYKAVKVVGSGDQMVIEEVSDESGFISLTKENDWSYSWDDLPRINGDDKFAYIVEEIDVNGFVASTTVQENETIKTYTIKNYKIPEEDTTSITVKKEWQDYQGNAVTVPNLPETIDFYLYQAVSSEPFTEVPQFGGHKYVITNDQRLKEPTAEDSDDNYGIWQLKKSDNFQTTFSDLPQKETINGSLVFYAYYVREIPIEGFTASYSNDGSTRSIINRLPLPKGEYIDLTLEKKWSNGIDSITPPTDATAEFAIHQLISVKQDNPKATITVKSGDVVVKAQKGETLTIYFTGDADKASANGNDFNWSLYGNHTVEYTVPDNAEENTTLVIKLTKWNGDETATVTEIIGQYPPTYTDYHENDEWNKTISLPTALGKWKTVLKNLVSEDEDGNKYKYYITEVNSSPEAKNITYDASIGDIDHPINTNNQKVTITNEIEENDNGSLKIRKVITQNGQDSLSNSVKTVASGEYEFAIYTNQECTDPLQKEGKDLVVKLTVPADGSSATSEEITDIPEGTYWVKETTPTNGTSPVQNPVSVVVKAGETGNKAAIATVTNNINTGSLEIVKTLAGGTAPTVDTEYHVTVSSNVEMNIDLTTDVTGAKNNSISLSNDKKKLYFTVIAKNGTNGTVSINGLVAGDYTVKETDQNGFAATYKIGTGEYTSSIPTAILEDKANDTKTITVLNTYPDAGTLKVKKSVTGEKAKTTGFRFTVQDSDGNYYDSNGVNKGKTVTAMTVSDGATVEILNLPMGTYTVTELGTNQYESDNDGAKVLGYTLVAAAPQTGKLENNGQVVEVTLTNRYTAKEGTAQIVGTKEYDRAFNAGEFTFEMIEVNEKGEPVAGSAVEMATLENDVNSADGTSGKYIGTFRFSQKTYKKIGTYYYKVTERKGNKSYVNYATNSYIVSVKVEDEGGDTTTLKTTVTTNPTGGVKFANTYKSTGSVTLEAQKTLAGGKLNENAFEFVLLDSNKKVLQTNKKNNDSGKVMFESIAYTQNDVSKSPFKYYIREVIPDDAENSAGQSYKGAQDKTGPFSKNGITYDGREIEVTVTLTDDGKGKITATPSYGTTPTGYTHANEFINKYTATGSLQLEAWKTLDGEAPTGNTFTFKITRVSQNGSAIMDGAYPKKETSDNDGKVEFPVIDFTREAVFGGNSTETEKTIYYLIEEVANSDDHTINYDTHKELVTVLLQDDGKGHINATPDKNGTSIHFNNTSVKNASATLQVNKTLTGRELQDGEFSFELTAKTEGDPNASGNQTKIIDTKANSGSVVAFKELNYSAETLGNNTSKNFTYEITEVIPEDAKNASGVAYANADNKTGPFIKNGISYDGKTITATVTVTKDGDKLKTSVSYTDNDSKSNNEKIFENTYDASGSAVIEATKALEGKKLEAKQYSFTLTGDKISGSQTKQNGAVENSAVGSITFEPIQYTLADLAGAKSRTFNYTIKEVLTNKISGVVYDEHQEDVTVTVTDTGNGTLETTVHYDTDGATFTNRYQTTPTDVQVTGMKSLNGDTLKANQFSFSLTKVSAKESAEAGAKDILDQNANQTKYNEANGDISFDRLHYEKSGIYTYQIRETSASGNGIAVDETVYTLTVTVTDNGEGQLVATRKLTYVNSEKQTVEVTNAVASFTNTYSAKGEAMIEAKKELEGKTLKKDQFTFTLTPESALGTDGTTKITDPNSTQTAKNDASGKVAFAKLNYTVPGTYTYEVRESGEDAQGIRIDQTVYQVSVRVFDQQHNGTLGTEVTYKNLTTNQNVSAPIVFKNVYTAEPVETELSAEKKLVDAEGKALDLGNRKFQFTMTLTEAKQDSTDLTNVAPPSRKAENTANGSVEFSKLTFTKPGVYVYTVSETTESGNGVIKDSSVYTVTYTVTDNGKGQLKLAREIKKGTETASDIVFTNQYKTNAATVDVTARKEITGRALKAQEFTFSLTKQSAVGADGSTAIADANENQTLVLNELDGSINFASLTYTQAGTYTYLMKEVTTSSDDVVTDLTEYTVIVTVTDNGNGQLSAKRVYKRGDETVADAEVKFVNQYRSGNLELTKEVTGNTVGDTEKQKEFTFTITLKDAAEKNISDTYSAIRTAENGAETETSVEFNNGNASVKLKHGEKLLIKGLPHKAAYTVSEMNAEGYVLQKISGQSGTIEMDQTKQVKAVNIHDTFGSLQLKKVLTGNDVELEREFMVQVTVYKPDGITIDTSVNGNMYGAAEFQEGISKPISIKSTGTKLISNLPNGAKYKVEELDSATNNALSVNQTDSKHHYILKSIVYTPNAEGVISSSTQQIATLTNERNSFGGLSVQKHVAGNASAQISNFEFTVTLGTDQNGKRINGTYGDMTFNDGVATFSLANVEVKTARGLPNGIPYEVVEKDYSRDGYETVYTHEKGLIIGDVAYPTAGAAQATEASINEKNKVEVINTRNADGTLSVTKKVEGNLGDRNKTFTIQITLGGTENLDHVVCSSNGGTMTLDQTTRTLTATLKAGQTASATGIPNGTPFTVSESGAEDYQITYQINGKTGTTGTIDEKNENKVTVTNTKNGYGGLKIIKKTAGNDPNKKSWFAFKVTLSEPLTGIFGSVRFENGVSAGPADTQGDVDYTNGKVPAGFFKVKVTEAIEGEEGKTGAVAITGLPAGITYTVEEADYSETYDTAVFTNASGTISSIADAPEKISADQITEQNVVTCVNTRNRWGKLVIRKKVQGQPVDPNKQYSFTIEIKDKNGQGLSGTYAGVEFTDGKGKVSLVAGEEKVITDLPLLSTFTVNEENASIKGYIWSEKHDLTYREKNAEGTKVEKTETNTNTGTIMVDQRIVTFTNTYEKPAIEKYVNKVVHSDLPAFDTPFVYDIISYIPIDADYAEIYDTLDDNIQDRDNKNALVFISKEDEVNVVDLGLTVDHTVHGSVESSGTTIAASAGVEKSINGKTLTVKINDATSLRGHWVKVMYTAQIDQNAIKSLADYEKATLTINENTPVLGGETQHTGIANTASYKVWVNHQGGSGSGSGGEGGSEGGGNTPGSDKPKYEEESNTVTVTPPTTKVFFTKKWTDENNAEKAWPDGVTVTVKLTKAKAGGAQTEVIGYEPVVLDGNKTEGSEGSEGSFENIPVYEGVTYSVAETVNGMDPRLFTMTLSDPDNTVAGEQHFTITNQILETSASVMKVWADEENQDGIRPLSLTVTLAADGVATDTKKTLNEQNHWTATVEHLPLMNTEGTAKIKYSWLEAETAGYTLTGTQELVAKDGTMSILINTHVPGTMEIPVRKVWDDNDNARNTRPASVKVQLFANGIARGEVLTLNAENGWRGSWTGLPGTENGKAIQYTVEEIGVPEGYSASVSGNAASGFTVTNSLERGKIVIAKTFEIEIPEEETEVEDEYREVTVRKVWVDNDDRDGNRPGSVTVHLYAGGTEVASAQITAAEGWEHTFYGLPATVDGRRIHYSVTEDPVAWYVGTVNGFTVTNTYQPETTRAAVTKIWNDNLNEQGIRPAQVRVTLSNGQGVVAQAVLSEENGWTATVGNLPTRVNGAEAVYTWSEEPVIGYVQEDIRVNGQMTEIVNKPWDRENIPENQKPKRVPGNTFYIFEDYDTPLGVEVLINHVGDCFD